MLNHDVVETAPFDDGFDGIDGLTRVDLRYSAVEAGWPGSLVK